MPARNHPTLQSRPLAGARGMEPDLKSAYPDQGASLKKAYVLCGMSFREFGQTVLSCCEGHTLG